MEKKLDINNMNGITEEEDKTCGLNDMNCSASASGVDMPHMRLKVFILNGMLYIWPL